MKRLWSSTKNQNRMMMLLTGAVIWLLLALCFDFYYDLNDDVVIKNIISGAYTGTPEGHTLQLLYPLGRLLSLLYRVVPAFPWYALFLVGCLCGSFVCMGIRLLGYADNNRKRFFLLAGFTLLFMALSFYELIFVQYTVVAAVLVLTAAVYFVTTPADLATGSFLVKNIQTILLLLVAFCLRSEMMLLCTPLLAMAGIYVWSREKKIFSKQSFLKYGLFLCIVAVGMAVSFLSDRAAYSAKEWQESTAFFDARTQVYDFTWYPSYEENEEFYDSIGISAAEFTLLDEYNFGLDKRITVDTLNQIAEYQKERIPQKRIGTVLSEYLYRMRQYSFPITWDETNDMPYNLIVVLLYGLCVITAVSAKDKTMFIKLPIMLALRSIPWLYLLYKGRLVTRVTHPLYFLEIGILVFLLISDDKTRRDKTENEKSACKILEKVILSGIFLIFCIAVVLQVKRVGEENSRREYVNLPMETLALYAQENPDNFYYLDVYSTVAFSQKMFSADDGIIQNYDIMGGWTSKTELSRKKETAYGIQDVEKDFLTKDTLFFAAQKERDVTWLTDYYRELGKTVTVLKTESLGEKETDFIIYRLKEE